MAYEQIYKTKNLSPNLVIHERIENNLCWCNVSTILNVENRKEENVSIRVFNSPWASSLKPERKDIIILTFLGSERKLFQKVFAYEWNYKTNKKLT